MEGDIVVRRLAFWSIFFGMGVLAIIGMPFWSGYISKTLLHEGIVEYIAHLNASGIASGVYSFMEWMFLISGGLTCAYMTRLFVI